MSANQPPLPSGSDSAASTQAARWQIGTLTYTRPGLQSLFFWLLCGDFAMNIRGNAIGPMALSYLQMHHASDALAGFLTNSLPCVILILLAPLLSMMSDRLRGPRGRRIPFILLGAPFATFAPVGFVFAPMIGRGIDILMGSHSPGYHTCVIIVFSFFLLIFDVANGFIGMGYGGLINDVVPHSVMGRFNGLFRAVSLLAGVIFSYYLMDSVETHPSWLIAGTTLLYGVCISLLCFRVKEGSYPPPPPRQPSPLADLSLFFRECYSKPYYLLMFSTLCITILAFIPVGTFSQYYAKSVGLSMQDYGRYMALTYACSFCFAYFLGSIADRIHPLPTSIVCMILYAATAFWSGFYARDSVTFSVAFVMHGVVSGFFLSASASMPQRLMPREKFAQFSTASAVFATPFWIIFPPIVGMVLDRTGHNYRYTFLISGTLATAAALSLLLLYRQFNRLGGTRNYQAPT